MSWPNPNIGKRSTDALIAKKEYVQALEKLNRHNDKPWAQFRLGYLYGNGLGVTRDYQKAMYWYLKASVQMSDDDWSKGKAFYGKSGFYAQNYDAYNAQLSIANMYLEGMGVEKSASEAYLWMNYALINAKKDDNNSVPQKHVDALEKIKKSLTVQEKQLVEDNEKNWEPAKSNIYQTMITEKPVKP
jgi:TPR repeat protein